MTPTQQFEAIRSIAQFCIARGWAHRLKPLRAHWLSVRGGADLSEHLENLLTVLQLPPFETAVRLRESHERPCSCPTATAASGGGAATLLIFVDRAMFRCASCGARWLERL